MKNAGISGVARRNYYVSFFLNILHIDDNIPNLLAGSSKTNNFLSEIFVRKPLEN